MQLLPLIALCGAIAEAFPQGLASRQANGSGTSMNGVTSNEFVDYGCRDIIFLFARGSTEVGNMGATVGPRVSAGLKKEFGDEAVATQGVDYAASLDTNRLPGGADPEGVEKMQDLLQKAHCQCPGSKIVASGYSQGAAVMHRAIEDRSDEVKDQIAGVVNFGDTQNKQDDGQIPNFPKDKVLIICNPGDAVCDGSLTVTAAHLMYTGQTDKAVDFLVEKVNAVPARFADQATSC